MRGAGRTVATMLVVPALVGTLALPAYALVPGDAGFASSDAFNQSQAEAQDIVVSDLATTSSVSRDGYAAVSAADLEAQRLADQRAAWEAQAAAARAAGGFSVVAEQAEGDDYPWWNQTPNDYGGGLSPLGYYYRECVDFVAWRMNRDAGSTGAPWRWVWANLASGSAWKWESEWRNHGWVVSSEPVTGAVAWFPYNHVAYVQSVGDGTVVLEEYNWNSDHSYHVRTIAWGDAIYLYPPK